MARLAGLWTFIALVLTPASAWAQQAAEPPSDAEAEPTDESVPPEARAAFMRGESAYQRELFTQAEDAFRRAYELMPAPNARRALLLLNIAVAVERQTGRDAEALELWERFRREAAADAEPELLVRADDRIRELRARIARRAEDATASPPPTASPTPTDDGTIAPIGPVVLGVGGAALLAGAILGGVVLAQDASLVATCPDGRCSDASALSLATQVEAMAIATDVLFIAGGVIAAAGLLLTLLLKDEPVRTSAGCGPNGCRATVTGAF